MERRWRTGEFVPQSADDPDTRRDGGDVDGKNGVSPVFVFDTLAGERGAGTLWPAAPPTDVEKTLDLSQVSMSQVGRWCTPLAKATKACSKGLESASSPWGSALPLAP